MSVMFALMKKMKLEFSDDNRLKHTYIIGKTGSGKTNLLKLMASQDVQVSLDEGNNN